jgi:HEAT repeat protein
MNTQNFLQKHQWEIIFAGISAIIVAILIAIFREVIKKFFSPIFKFFAKLSATNRFEHYYRDWLINKYRFLNVRGIKTNAPVAIELEKVFISLRSRRSSHSAAFPGRTSQREFEINLDTSYIGDQIRDEFGRKFEGEYEKQKIYELKDLFSLRQKRFIIIGAPGSGKTTLLNYLALKFARKAVAELFVIDNEILPIFINLRDTIKGDFLDVRRFSENYNKYIECPHSPPRDFFESRLEEGKCIILLDGLDEVSRAEERINVAKWVDSLSLTYPRNIFIATSRPYGYETAHLYNDFLEFHILDFTPEQVRQFARYWTKAVEIKAAENESEYTIKEAEKRAVDLLSAIKENPRIEALTVNPLLLTIVSLVHRYRAALPKRRVELYEECCDVLLGYWDTSKGLVGELDPRKTRAILQPLAYYLHFNGLREERKEKFIELLENELPKIAVSKEKANELLDQIRDRCGILVETKLGYFGFSHLTFQEFLTARHILDDDLENFLVKQKRDKYWLEVTLLYCGMKETTNLINKILTKKEDIFHTNLFLAGRCLAESLTVCPKLRGSITQDLFDVYWEENQFNLSKDTSVEILKEVKDSQIIQKFIDKTKDKRSDVIRRAASAIGQIQAKEATPLLINLLEAIDGDVRESAVFALGQIQDEQAILPLIDHLKAKDNNVRRSAVSTLGQMRAKQAVSPLIKLLKDEKNDIIRGRVVSALGLIQDKEANSHLIDLLKFKDSDVRGSAASALGETHAKEATSLLIKLLRDKESDVRWRAAYALGQIQAKEAVSHLIKLLKDPKSVVRQNAAYALGQIQAKASVPLLIELLKDEDSNVRASAASALGQMQAKEAVMPLIELFNDKEFYVRERATSALGQIQAEESILPLIGHLKDKESNVRCRAASALGQMQAKDAASDLIELLKDEETDVIWRAASALGQMQAKEAVKPLIELLKDKESYVRRTAAYALGQIQSHEAVFPLIELLKDKESDVRWLAADALGKIGDKRVVDSLMLLLNDRESSTYGWVRDSAFNALKAISEKTDTPIFYRN